MAPLLGMFSSTSVVCKLKRSLYDLKQTPWAWFDKFLSTLLCFFFMQSKYDSSLFLCKLSTGFLILLVYMDDTVIIRTDSLLISNLQYHFQDCFHIKDPSSLLGIRSSFYFFWCVFAST
jgi:hypothetical protein